MTPKTARDWQELTYLTQGRPVVVVCVCFVVLVVVFVGVFVLLFFVCFVVVVLVFVVVFVKSHGSIKEMERVFGVSYPTIKARLNRIAGQLEFVDTDPGPTRREVLDRLEQGEISAADAIRELEALK